MSRLALNPLSPSLGMPRTHTAMINEALRQVGEMANSTGTGGILVQRGPLGTSYQDARQALQDDQWYGVLVNAGPSGEADFADSRYWVVSVLLAQAERAGSYDATKPYLDLWSPNARWGVASNIAESVLGTHSLATISPTANRGQPLSSACTLVKVQTLDAAKMATQADDAANTVAVFTPLVPATRLITGLITGNAAGSGKYTGKSFSSITADVSAATTLAASELGGLAAANDCLVCNLAELGSSTTGHDVTAAANTAQFAIYFVGVCRWTNTDGTKVIEAAEFYVGCT